MNYQPSILPTDLKDLLPFLNREFQIIATAIAEKTPRLWYGTAILTPPTLTGDVNDYAPTGLEGALWVRLASTLPCLVTGIRNPEASTPRFLFVSNVGAQPIALSHASTNSLATSRFNFVGSADIPLLANASVLIGYDIKVSVWRSLAEAI